VGNTEAHLMPESNDRRDNLAALRVSVMELTKLLSAFNSSKGGA
jgi:hypothetical protein